MAETKTLQIARVILPESFLSFSFHTAGFHNDGMLIEIAVFQSNPIKQSNSNQNNVLTLDLKQVTFNQFVVIVEVKTTFRMIGKFN
jgi:hypothetical protein